MSDQLTRDILAASAICDGLEPEDIERLAAAAHASRVRAGTNVLNLEQPGESVYYLITGTLRVQVEQEDGATVILAYLMRGELVGEMGVVERSTRSATVVAVEECELLWIDRRAFNSCLRETPRLAWNVLGIMSRRIRLANERIQLLRHDVPGRVAHLLVAYANLYGEPTPAGVQIPLRLTQSDLAHIVLASRERVNRAVKMLCDKGEIEVDAGYRITVINPEALRRRFG